MKKRKTFADLKEKEWHDKQQLIIDAAERLFSLKTFDKVNIRDIAAEAGISPTTIYRYFPDQQTLFVEAFLKESEEIITLLDKIAKQSNASKAVETMAEAYVNFLNENDHYFRMMTHFMLDGNLRPELLKRLNAIERDVFDKIEVILKAGGVTDNTRKHTHAFFASLNGILISFRNYPGRDRKVILAHMKFLAILIARLFCRG